MFEVSLLICHNIFALQHNVSFTSCCQQHLQFISIICAAPPRDLATCQQQVGLRVLKGGRSSLALTPALNSNSETFFPLVFSYTFFFFLVIFAKCSGVGEERENYDIS